MKKIFLIPFLTVLASVSTVFGQSKIGYVQYDYVLSLMPEITSIKAKLEEKQKGYETSIESMKKEMSDIEGLLQNTPTIDETIKNSKIRRYQNLQQEIQEFAYQAEEKMSAAQVEFMKPVYEKLKVAIGEVSKEKGFDYVLSENNSGGFVVVYSKNESDNITKAVMTKLSIKEPVTTPSAGTAPKATESLMVKPK